MKKFFAVLFVVISVNYSFAQAPAWKNDPEHSKLTFTVTHLGISSVFGLFQKFHATIISSKPDFSDAVFTLSVNVASVNTGVKLCDDHLRAKDFFSVVEYPLMSSKSNSIVNTTGMKDRFTINGDLTMRGVTRSVTMNLWFRGTTVDASSKKIKAGFRLTGVIDRADFGVGAPDPFDVSTDVEIKADGEFLKQQ